MSIPILQPHIPHYRESFFRKLNQKLSVEIYCYEANNASKSGFQNATIPFDKINAISKGPFLWFNPITFLKSKSKKWILMLHFGHLTTWLLLLTKFLHQREIILWGQGISVKRYLEEDLNPDWKLKLMIALSDGLWLYTEKEAKQWKAIFPNKKIVALNNTQECKIPKMTNKEDIQNLKLKYGIPQERVLIFSARFENPYRRTDLLIEVLKHLDKDKFGFIIIGDGSLKPDFSSFSNVYDYGRLYDENVKSDLFSIADIYFQPGWVGLSIVEAMAYSLPIFTFERSNEIKQCVEYYYVQNNVNGMIFKTLHACINEIENASDNKLQELGNNSFLLYSNKLTIENMVNNAIKTIV